MDRNREPEAPIEVSEDQQASGSERRKYRRVPTDSVVSIRRIDSAEIVAQALDLSLGGIRFQCVGIEVEVGETVAVDIMLEGSTASVLGRLVRVTELDAFCQEVAMAFLEMNDETEQVLKETLPEPHEEDTPDRDQ